MFLPESMFLPLKISLHVAQRFSYWEPEKHSSGCNIISVLDEGNWTTGHFLFSLALCDGEFECYKKKWRWLVWLFLHCTNLIISGRQAFEELVWGGCQIWIWHFGNWKNLLIIDTINYTPVSADGNANTIFLTNERFNWMIMMVFCYKVISSSLPKANTKRCLHRIHYMSLLPIHIYNWYLVLGQNLQKLNSPQLHID